MQTPLPIFMKDTQCAETNEKSIFWFLFFVLWSILFTIFKCFYLNNQPKLSTKKVPSKDAKCSETDFLVLDFFCAIFSFWDMVDSVFNSGKHSTVNWGLERILRIWFRNADQWYPRTSWLGWFHPKASGAWGTKPPTKNGEFRGGGRALNKVFPEFQYKMCYVVKTKNSFQNHIWRKKKLVHSTLGNYGAVPVNSKYNQA